MLEQARPASHIHKVEHSLRNRGKHEQALLYQSDENLSKRTIVHCSFAVAARASSLQLYIASSSNFQLGAELSNEELGKMLPLLCLFCLQLLQPLQPRPIRPPQPPAPRRTPPLLPSLHCRRRGCCLIAYVDIFRRNHIKKNFLPAIGQSLQHAASQSQSYYCNSRQFCIFILLVFVYTEGILIHQKYLVNNTLLLSVIYQTF